MVITCPRCNAANSGDSRLCQQCGTPWISNDEAATIDPAFVSPGAQSQPPASELSSGAMIGIKYKILGKIGRGGMGVVYQAEDLRLKRTVALKFLSPELTGEPEARERLMHEARAASELDHPNICTVHEIDETETGQMYIAMAYYKGESLKERIQRGPLGIDEIVDLILQLSRGLAKAHERGIVHRDIKPANLLITEDGLVKIVDFGLAKLSGTAGITKVGTTVGTAAYMSPEQAQGHEVDQRTDIWSLGVVLYEMLTGRQPFRGDHSTSLLYAVVHEKPTPARNLRSEVPLEMERITDRALEKAPQRRYASVAEMLVELENYKRILSAPQQPVPGFGEILRRARTPRIAVPGLSGLIVLGVFGFWFLNRQVKFHQAETLLPKIHEVVETGWENYIDAYKLALEAERYMPDDPRLATFFSKIAMNLSIKTEPEGANIYLKPYKDPDGPWNFAGISPIEKIRLPMGYFRLKIEKEGYDPVLAATTTFSWNMGGGPLFVPNNISRTLDKTGQIPPGMVRVTSPPGLDDFFTDRYEVSNRQFREFVNKGGYQKKEYWKVEFTKDGRVLKWEEAVREFVDQTGRPGPATWQAGDYEKGHDDYPVSGISWYEAAAYAEFAGKSLPTAPHWDIARGALTPLIQNLQFSPLLNPLSNFNAGGPAPVGSHPGITAYGAYDMAGNVREWCWNEIGKGRMLRGGAWDDATYLFDYWSQADPFDRSPRNGFRCVKYLDAGKIPATMLGVQKPQTMLGMESSAAARDFTKEKPVSDSVFQAYKEHYSYDKTNLRDARVEMKKDDSPDWILEKITFDAAYDNERVMAYLFVPKRFSPPYQTVIYFPGTTTVLMSSSKDIENYWEYERNLSFIVKNGRAVLFPVYKGTFERRSNDLAALHLGNMSHQYRDFYIKVTKDLRKSIDYLETRPDIDRRKLAYFGFSWGGCGGTIIPAVEDRIKVSILDVGYFGPEVLPEVNQINFITRVKIPTLMLNGTYDVLIPYEAAVKPMFELLGTPREQKMLKLYPTDHFIPRNELIKETLSWLDRFLGPVK